MSLRAYTKADYDAMKKPVDKRGREKKVKEKKRVIENITKPKTKGQRGRVQKTLNTQSLS